jgi:hypothetical protein
LSENEVVGTEEGAQGSGANRVHGTRLKVNKNRARNVFVGSDLVVIDRDTFQLEVGGSFVETVSLDTMLIGDDFPELGTYVNCQDTYTRSEKVKDVPIWLPHCHHIEKVLRQDCKRDKEDSKLT